MSFSARKPGPRFEPRPRLTDAFINSVNEAVDLEDLVSESVDLRRSGTTVMGKCPFHNDGTASLSVSSEKGFFNCFGCGAGGNAVKWAQLTYGLPFPKAVQMLAERAGIPFPHAGDAPQLMPRPTPVVRPKPNEASALPVAPVENLYQVTRIAADAYIAALVRSPEAIAYLESRGITPEIARRYVIGFAPDEFGFLKGAFGNDYARNTDLIAAGLSKEKITPERNTRWDFFRKRVIFGVRDKEGRPIAFGGRVLPGDDGPKYLNTPETGIFHKGEVVYGLYEAASAIRAVQRACVVEGYMDVLSLAGKGVKNAVACMGTAVTESQIEQILAHTRDVLFVMDGDAAGRKAMLRALLLVIPYADANRFQFLLLPDDLDPDEYVRAHGPAAFREEHHLGIGEALSKLLAEQADAADEAGKRSLLQRAARAIEKLDPSSPLAADLRARMTRIEGIESPNPALARPPRAPAAKPVALPAIPPAGERLLNAAMRLPGEAGRARMNVNSVFAAGAGPDMVEREFLARLDAAIAAGKAAPSQCTDQERRSYERVLEASGAIAGEIRRSREAAAAARLLARGEISDSAYLAARTRE
ncbi:DNA primase (plasmid) [Cupriavidus pinatubonensis]|uniref:DNA primase n=1 Tax=Cupriavidus pinatubonensis TaxID=248026 RepID=UPI001C72B2FF|nr:DNA primase [Cupriavidus pinatubonensis]QYY33726.1 DNA primase [Cupriavidus pinatubonensis]